MPAKVFPESGAEHTGVDDLHEAIRRRAEEIYERSGKIPGRDTENWMLAEREIRHERQAGRRTAVVVKVEGTEYVGEYTSAAGDYAPGEFSAGDPVAVRLEGGKMYVKRPNGKELETTIVATYS